MKKIDSRPDIVWQILVYEPKNSENATLNVAKTILRGTRLHSFSSRIHLLVHIAYRNRLDFKLLPDFVNFWFRDYALKRLLFYVHSSL